MYTLYLYNTVDIKQWHRGADARSKSKKKLIKRKYLKIGIEEHICSFMLIIKMYPIVLVAKNTENILMYMLGN